MTTVLPFRHFAIDTWLFVSPLWSGLTETLPYFQIGLVDRTLMPGDVVRRHLPGQKHLSGQAGYVRDVNVRADVKILGTKYVIRNVPSERLRPICEWSRDTPVCLGNWIGYTLSVDESAVLK